jgi:tRNA-uridine 2-sulfurtransferase
LNIGNRNKRVVVAMSGGVDSSVAAAVLLEQGYDVIGITMKLHEYADTGDGANDRSCCDLESYNDAARVCHKLGVPHYVIDLVSEFRKDVIDNFVDEYLGGRTPNPCVLCNTKLKWEYLYSKAMDLEASWIATGHYAQIVHSADGGSQLLRGSDPFKDQSYALWGIKREQLSKTLFPIGDISKAEAREIARRFKLLNAEKAESQDICFVPDGDYGSFLKRYAPGKMRSIESGEILDKDGQVVGEHRGLPFYTIGQRRGLNIAMGKPVYVNKINYEKNQLEIGNEDDLKRQGLLAGAFNWLIEYPQDVLYCHAAIRYHDKGSACRVEANSKEIRLIFDEPKKAITPGQSVVLYDGDRLLGGGIINRSLPE